MLGAGVGLLTFLLSSLLLVASLWKREALNSMFGLYLASEVQLIFMDCFPLSDQSLGLFKGQVI